MPLKELHAIRINYLIKIRCGGWKVPLVYTLSHPYEKEVWSVLNYTCKIRPPKGIRNDQEAYYNFFWMAYANILFPFISNVKISKKKTLDRYKFCLLTILKKKAQKNWTRSNLGKLLFLINEIPDKVFSLLVSIQFMHLKVFWLCFLRVILIIYSVEVSFSVNKVKKNST